MLNFLSKEVRLSTYSSGWYRITT